MMALSAIATAKRIRKAKRTRSTNRMDAFVTVTLNLSPSDFYLYRLGADNVVSFVNESPYHGDFSATSVYAFDGEPPEHLINTQGLMLRFSLECSASGTSMFMSQCFVKDGALGTLTGAQRFVAMDNAGPTLTALVDPRGDIFTQVNASDAGYLLQTIDVPSRTVSSQVTVHLPQGTPTKLEAVLERQVAVVGVDKRPAFPSTSSASGYEVVRLPLAP
jgi:hypothetical protein